MPGKPGRPRKERSEGDEGGKIWGVRDVGEETRRRVRAYAAEHGLSVGQALMDLVDVATGGISGSDPTTLIFHKVDPKTRVRLKVYTLVHDLSMEQALRDLVEIAIHDTAEDDLVEAVLTGPDGPLLVKPHMRQLFGGDIQEFRQTADAEDQSTGQPGE